MFRARFPHRFRSMCDADNRSHLLVQARSCFDPRPSSMGSWGDRWLQCVWCTRWGKNTEWYWDYASSRYECGHTDVDGIGVLCEPCYIRFGPPHCEYIERILRGLESRVPCIAALADEIAQYAYPLYWKRYYEPTLYRWVDDPRSTIRSV